MPSEEWFDSLTKESKQAYLPAKHNSISQHQDRTTVTSTSIYSSHLFSGFICFSKIFILLTTMCNKKAPITKRQVGNEEKTTNLGLLNISSNSMSWISLETILEVITVLILTILVIRWYKYLAKRKESRQRKLMDLIRPSASEYPRGFISELPAIQTHSTLEH